MNIKSKQLKNAFVLIAFGIILMWALDNLESLWNVIAAIFLVLSPFIIGVVIAFIMNVPMRFFERKLLKKVPQKLKRAISYIITLLLFIIIIMVTSFIVIPEFYNSIHELVNRIPSAWNDFLAWVERMDITENDNIENFLNSINLDWDSIEQQGISLISDRASQWLTSTFNVATSVVGTITSAVIGFVFSIYVLFQKEKLISQIRRVSLAVLPLKVHKKLVYLVDLTNTTFSNFLSVQLLEALIIGSMFFIAMKIFRFPFALVISVLIGITSFVPIVGAFIGAIVGTLLILVEDVQLAFWFVVMFLIIQQIEGNIIYPNVAGKTVGLPSMWILVAVTIGGNLLGVMGIILFVPIGTILYSLTKLFVSNRLKARKVSQEDINGYKDSETMDETGYKKS